MFHYVLGLDFQELKLISYLTKKKDRCCLSIDIKKRHFKELTFKWFIFRRYCL